LNIALEDAAGNDLGLEPIEEILAFGSRESASVCLGAVHDFLARYPDAIFEGTISFATSDDRKQTNAFVLSAKHLKRQLTFTSEGPRALFELQKVPEELRKIGSILRERR